MKCKVATIRCNALGCGSKYQTERLVRQAAEQEPSVSCRVV